MPPERRPRFRGRQYAALLFDMDGTLLDSSGVVERTWRTWAQKYDIEPAELLEAAHGVRSEDTIRRFAPVGIDVARDVAWFHLMELSDVDGLVPIAGIGPLLDSLQPESWAVVTSASRQLAELRIRSVHLPVPKTLISAEDVARGKPDPEGYLKAAQALGVQISECLVFEDSPAGVAAARAAGAQVAIVGNQAIFGNQVIDGAGVFSIADYRS